ncbi:MAG: UDP-N-acetylmuramoyl-L-alanyl-D-glutamate--2,6-diaminopimelate ligase [Burkholderiales bacterium]|nr:UDP-N-acetylmuramoyl-L-alanyl-D-glutamate--2,6-diaminopimelate ligase [Burkholderiales bacterium]
MKTATGILIQLQRQGVNIGGLSADSRALRAGDTFVAYPGANTDGRRYIADAIVRGAGAVLWEREGFSWNEAWRVPNIAVDGLRALAGYIAHEVYGRPSENLWLAGVTGTNGKTSCSQWIAQAFNALGRKTAVIGTLGSGFPAEKLVPSINTTPDAIELHRQLAGFLRSGAQGVVMEVSSVGLDQGRVNGAQFDVALLTNLSRDHLDYHGDMERYAAAKAQLFDAPGLSGAVLNMDDVLGVRIAQKLAGSKVACAGYSAHAGVASAAGLEYSLEAENIRLTQEGLVFGLVSSWGRAEVKSALHGRFNVSNLLGVLGVLLGAGVALEQAVSAVAALTSPSGRMQTLGGAGRPRAVVDYAHSPDALEEALISLRPLADAGRGRLVCVFGCGGERDRGKRSLMGAIAARNADQVLLTSDNPRGEEPMAIITDILEGVLAEAGTGQPPLVIADRREAIAAAISAAGADDVVLIAGKGHEDYQESAGQRIPFSDAVVAAEALAAWKR